MEVDVKRETFRIHRKSNYGNLIDCNIENKNSKTPNAFGIFAFITRSQQHIQSHHCNKNWSTSRSNVKTGMNVNAWGDFTERLFMVEKSLMFSQCKRFKHKRYTRCCTTSCNLSNICLRFL